MFVVYRQDGFAAKPIELYHSDYRENADKFALDYKEGVHHGVLVFVKEEPGSNTRSNAAKEKADYEKNNRAPQAPVQGGN